jgi:phosphatidylserine/phosphatidylglycerophosphate/cardiolipin synthase-like enzyme
VTCVDRVGRYSPADLPALGVWDELGAANPGSVGGRLCVAEAQINAEGFAGKVAKFAVIYVEGSGPAVILGSYNWMDSGAYDNDENTLILHDWGLARAYHAEWQRMWEAPGAETL